MDNRDLHSAAFPKFSEAQLTSLGQCSLTAHKQFRAGDRLYETCQLDFTFFVIKSGEVEIVDESGDVEKTVVVLGPGEFTGEVSQLTGNPSLVTAVARGDVEAYEISRDPLRQILNEHPDLGDMILQAFIARRQLLRDPETFTGLRVIGSRYSADTFRIREFLMKNAMPFTWVDLESDPGVDLLLKQFAVNEAQTPVVVWGRTVLGRNPSNRELADALGLRPRLEQTTMYDLVVVGAGPAGLAAAVYGASEGLQTVVLERTAPGGQAGRSMRIENYLGFPTGITGGELAERAVVQVTKFGARLSIPTPVAGLNFDNTYCVVNLEDGETVITKCLLIATGADYRLLNVEGCEQFEGRGIYYAATHTEAQMCAGAEVVVVGGGNSAGQAAVFLSTHARKVHLLIRGNDLYKSMSSYLVKRIEQTPNVELVCNTEIARMAGDGYLGEVEIVNRKTGQTQMLAVAGVFSFIGATPRTDWLPPEIEKDARQFVRTGPSLANSPHWSSGRDPFLLETSRRGVFAAGDVRSGSVKRVASAVGEGAMAVQFVHEYLREM